MAGLEVIFIERKLPDSGVSFFVVPGIREKYATYVPKECADPCHATIIQARGGG